MQQQRHHNQIEQFLQHLNETNHDGAMHREEPTQPTDETEPEETIHVYLVRERDDPQDQVIETTLAKSQHPSSLLTAAILFFYLCLPFSSILFQLYLALSPPIATVTIMPSVQTVTLIGTVPLGRLVHPITLSQSQITPTTGKGHQDAREATGTLTFYNGQLQSITVPAGTILTGSDGVQIVTDHDALIPAADLTANPPIVGHTSVSAHAVRVGAGGNIAAYDINEACCSSVVAKNLSDFTGGQDERDFPTVAEADVTDTATPLQPSLAQRTKGALQGQLQSGEVLLAPICATQVVPSHQIGEEAAQVTVSVSETCRAGAYNTEQLQRTATQLLISQAMRTVGPGYRQEGNLHVTVNQATLRGTTPILMFSSKSTWVYTLTVKEQEHIKTMSAGKTTQDTLQRLRSLPGIEQVSIAWRDDTKLPKDIHYIHLVIVIRNS